MQENGNHPTVRIGTWNTEWRRPNKPNGKIIGEKLAATDCDILCVTEGFAGILPAGGHVIDAGEDWGCPIKPGRRKVLLWSKQPWTPHTHALGSEEIPEGRFVAGTTETTSGVRLTIVGACIPWSHSHVSTCRKNRKPWEDHEAWLAGFEKLRCHFLDSTTVVLGDFNQRIHPTIHPKWVPRRLSERLKQAFEGFKFATEGDLPGGLMAIDHIAHTPDLKRRNIKIWPKRCADGRRLSDHFGVWGDFDLG